MSSKVINRICAIVFVLAWLNFMAFCYISQRIGGEAIHGNVEGGHYYLATGYISQGIPRLDAPHKYIEVSPGVFQYSRIHGYSVLVTFPFGLVGGLLGFIYGKRRKQEFTASDKQIRSPAHRRLAFALICYLVTFTFATGWIDMPTWLRVVLYVGGAWVIISVFAPQPKDGKPDT